MSDRAELQSALNYVYKNKDLIEEKYKDGNENAKLIIEAYQLLSSGYDPCAAALLISGVDDFRGDY